MSRKRIAIVTSALALLLLVAGGGRLAARVEGWFLALHGHPGAKAPVAKVDEEAESGRTANKGAAPTPMRRDGWPDTPAGIVAGGWVDAFSTGEAAMAKFLEEHLSEASRVQHPMGERMASYRDLRHRFGDLMLASVVQSTPHELTVVLLTEDASRHRFVFTVREDDPHKLVQVGILQHGHGSSD
jgi:hypothetical protein